MPTASASSSCSTASAGKPRATSSAQATPPTCCPIARRSRSATTSPSAPWRSPTPRSRRSPTTAPPCGTARSRSAISACRAPRRRRFARSSSAASRGWAAEAEQRARSLDAQTDALEHRFQRINRGQRRARGRQDRAVGRRRARQAGVRARHPLRRDPLGVDARAARRAGAARQGDRWRRSRHRDGRRAGARDGGAAPGAVEPVRRDDPVARGRAADRAEARRRATGAVGAGARAAPRRAARRARRRSPDRRADEDLPGSQSRRPRRDRRVRPAHRRVAGSVDADPRAAATGRRSR